MEADKTELSDLFKKVMEGITEANRKLVEQRAAEGASLVVFKDGETKSVPAKELLAELNLAKPVPAQ